MDSEAQYEDVPEPADRDGPDGHAAHAPADDRADDPDVLLDVPNLSVDEISLEVEDLRARVSLRAEVLDLLKLSVGADVELGRVHLDIKGVQAQALLKVRLDNVAEIVDRVLTTIDRNPQILEQVTSGVGEAARELGGGAREAVGELGRGTGEAVENVGEGAGGAVEEVGHGAGRAVEDVGEGAGEAVEDVGRGAGEAAEKVGEATGEVAEEAGRSAGKAVGAADETGHREPKKSARQASGRSRKAAAPSSRRGTERRGSRTGGPRKRDRPP